MVVTRLVNTGPVFMPFSQADAVLVDAAKLITAYGQSTIKMCGSWKLANFQV